MTAISSYFIVTSVLCLLMLFLGYGVRYGHMLFLVPGLDAKMVPRKIATSKYFGNRFLIVGILGVPFSTIHLLVDGTVEMALTGFYCIIVLGFIVFIGATVARLNEYNKKVMTRYRQVKREKEKEKVKPRPVGRGTGNAPAEAPEADGIVPAPQAGGSVSAPQA